MDETPSIPVEERKTCKTCHIFIQPEWYFCPNCGRKLRERPISVGRIVWVGFVSLFLPPFGLVYTKYLFHPYARSKWVGLAAILLTIVSVIVTTYLLFQASHLFIQQLNNSLTTGYTGL